MKIGIDLRSLLTKNYSGIPEYVSCLITILAKQNTHTIMGWYNQRKVAYIPDFITQNIEINKTTTANKLLNTKLAFFDSPSFDTFFHNSDIVWMPDINFWSPLKKGKLVVTIHDISYLRFPEFFSYKSKLWTRLCRAVTLIKSADHLIAVSKSTKHDLVSILGIAPEKITVVHEGIDTQLLTAASTDEKLSVQKKYNLPEKFALFIGTIEPRKNLVGAIQAMNLATDLPLVVAGKWGWKYDEVKKAAKISKNKVIFLDYIPRADKSSLLALADFLLWPSFYEGFGLPVLEAQAQGTPVITSANSSLGEIAENSAILVNPYDVTSIAQGITELVNSPTLRDTLRTRGYENIKRFSWEKAAKETLEVFNKIA